VSQDLVTALTQGFLDLQAPGLLEQEEILQVRMKKLGMFLIKWN
jgi:hypothetical protein